MAVPQKIDKDAASGQPRSVKSLSGNYGEIVGILMRERLSDAKTD